MGEIGGARIPLNSTEVARAKGVEPSRVGLKARCSAFELRPHHSVSCLCVPDVRFTPHLSLALQRGRTFSSLAPQRGRTFSHTGSLAPPGRGPPARPAVPGVRTAPGPHDRLSSVVNVPQGAHIGRALSWRGGHYRHRSRWPDSNGRSPAPKAGAFARLRYTSIGPSHDGRRDEEESNLWPPASQTGALSV